MSDVENKQQAEQEPSAGDTQQDELKKLVAERDTFKQELEQSNNRIKTLEERIAEIPKPQSELEKARDLAKTDSERAELDRQIEQTKLKAEVARLTKEREQIEAKERFRKAIGEAPHLASISLPEMTAEQAEAFGKELAKAYNDGIASVKSEAAKKAAPEIPNKGVKDDGLSFTQRINKYNNKFRMN